jgi:hypothetical protein
MIWKKSRLITWQTADFRIVEIPDAEMPFRLSSLYAADESFATLEQAKTHANLQGRLAATEEENRRLRAELDTHAGRWPEAPKLNDENDDGRGIPRQQSIPA